MPRVWIPMQASSDSAVWEQAEMIEGKSEIQHCVEFGHLLSFV